MTTNRSASAGAALAFLAAASFAADFNADGYADLAIGAPSDRVNGFDGAGSVHVIYGGPEGLDASDPLRVENWSEASLVGLGAPAPFEEFGSPLAAGDLWLHQDTIGAPDQNEWGDRFGDALAVADFDGDGASDLAVGVPGEAGFGGAGAGGVLVVPGTGLGISIDASQALWLDAAAGWLTSPGGPEAGEWFGGALR